MIEKFLTGEKRKLESEFEKLENAIEHDYESGPLDFAIDGLAEEYHSVSKTFPHNFRASFFIQIIAFIEFELKEICEHHHKVCNTDFSIDDLRGSNEIEKAKLYLSNSCNVDINKLNPEWNFIQVAKEIRNLIVHQQGELIANGSKRTKKILKFISQKDYIKLDLKKIVINGELVDGENGTINICDKKANKELLDVTKTFFTRLLKSELKYSS